MDTLPKTTYRVDIISIKHSLIFLTKLEKNVKIYMEPNGAQIAMTIVSKRAKLEA